MSSFAWNTGMGSGSGSGNTNAGDVLLSQLLSDAARRASSAVFPPDGPLFHSDNGMIATTRWTSDGMMMTTAATNNGTSSQATGSSSSSSSNNNNNVGELLTRGHSGAGSYCCKCGSSRADVRFPCCGNVAHARCIYPWPCTACPSCASTLNNGGAGVEVLAPDPFSRNGEIVELPPSVMEKLRGGRWSEAEYKFAEMVIDGFASGMLSINEGTRLGTFLCNLLQCTSARLSSKLRTGKKNFKYLRAGQHVRPEQIYEYEQQQRRLSQQEELFLHYLSSEEAAVASRSLQLEWRIQFVLLAKRMGQAIANLEEWEPHLRKHGGATSEPATPRSPSSSSSSSSSSTRRQKRAAPAGARSRRDRHDWPADARDDYSLDGSGSSVRSDHLQHEGSDRFPSPPPPLDRSGTSSIYSVASSASSPSTSHVMYNHDPAQQQKQQELMRGLAPLMVRMAADRRRNFTVSHGVMGATTIEDLLGLLRAGPNTECALLARASNGSILFVSAGLQRMLRRDDADLLGSFLFDGNAGLVHTEDSIVLQCAFRQSQEQVAHLLERMGNPQLPFQEKDVLVIPVVLRLRCRDHSYSQKQLTAFATEDFLLLHHAASQPPPVHMHMHQQEQQYQHQQQQHYQQQQQQQQYRQVQETGIEAGFRNMAIAPTTALPPFPPRAASDPLMLPSHLQQQQHQEPPPQLMYSTSDSMKIPQVIPPPVHSSQTPSSASSPQHLPQQHHHQQQYTHPSQLRPEQGQHGMAPPASLQYNQVNALQTLTHTLPSFVGTATAAHNHGNTLSFPSSRLQHQQQLHDSRSCNLGAGGGGENYSMDIVPMDNNDNTNVPRIQEVDENGNVLKTTKDGEDGEDEEGHDTLKDASLWDEGLEWCTDDDLSMALANLARGDSPQPRSAGHEGGGRVQDAWGGAYDLCYAPPTSFEETMRTFLQGLPFEAVDIWVPLRDPTSDQTSLQFGGGLAVRADLSSWIFYSRNFAFYEGQGMPGRVFRSQVPEFREDVASMDSSLFLRRDGAMMAGVHATFGVPVVQDQTVFVLVFYSARKSPNISQEVLDFIRRSTASWRIQTTFTPTLGSSSSSASATIQPMAPSNVPSPLSPSTVAR